MKTIIRSLVAAAAIATVAGCGPLAGMLTNPPVPLPGTSAAPGTAASTAPVTGASTAPATTPTAKPSTAASASPAGGLQGPEACKRELGEYDTGSAKLGAFANQRLPKGWNTDLDTEAEVYSAIDNLFQNDWPCFQKFYPGAAGLYKTKNNIK